MTAPPPALARPDRGINHVVAYGQSLSSGWEGNPALTRVARLDTLMLGDCVRPLGENTTAWEPVGGAAFRALRATVQDRLGGAVLTAEAVASAPADAGFLGETVLEGALNHWRARMRDDASGVLDPRRQLLASSCGVGGRALEALARGAAPELFNRLRDCVRTARTLAETQRRSYGLVAVLFLQGEHNNLAADGATADPAKYGALLRALYADIVADVARGVAGQDAAPAMFCYQTGGSYASETNSVPQAQLETALSTPGCFLAAPVYPVTDKGGHLDANGYRWLGAQFGKVMHRVLSRGEAWRPLHPVRATRDGDAVRVDFHVPHPPLAWARPYVGHAARDIHDRGFALYDAAGEVPIADVAFDGATSVRIASARPLGTAPRIRYAARGRMGRGCLCDSDPTLSDDVYMAGIEQGHRASADIAELRGRPYPLMNWCVAFSMDVG